LSAIRDTAPHTAPHEVVGSRLMRWAGRRANAGGQLLIEVRCLEDGPQESLEIHLVPFWSYAELAPTRLPGTPGLRLDSESPDLPSWSEI
jgi:hypothetical protein